MRGTPTVLTIFLVVVAAAMAFALVTSISSLAMPAASAPGVDQNLQELTPTPAASVDSVAGSTDGILWMGVVIAAIVVLPVLLTRSFWRTQS